MICDPAVWERFGITDVEVVPDGEPFPIEIEDEHRPDGRLEVIPVWSPHRTMHYPWPDVVAAAIRSGRVPRIVRATRLVPVGRQANLRRRLPVLPGVVLDANTDPVLMLVPARRMAKAAGDMTLARELHAVTNSLVFGIFGRFDELLHKRNGKWELHERPGPWNCLPIASTVSSGAHLLLAVFDRLVTDRNSVVAYRDTDSSIVPATPEGGTLTLADGTTIHALSWTEMDEIVEVFAPLSPEPDWPVWKSVRGTTDAPLQVLVFGPKRHVEFIER